MMRSFRITAAATMLVLVASATGVAATAQTFEEGMRAYRSGDYHTAYHAFRGLAEEGDRRAQGSLGDMYRKGYGVAQDHAEAMKWYQRAADQGGAHAQDGLGLMYRDGLGLPRHAECAYIWFDLAARNFPASRSNRREQAAGNRDRVAGSLNQQALERAQRIAGQWRPGTSLDCPTPLSPGAGTGFSRNGAWLPVAIIAVGLALVTIFALFRVRSRRERREPEPRPPTSDPGTRPPLPKVGSVIAGKAWVTDGDGLRVSGHTIRIAGIDAPEHDQPATHKDGYRIEHGKRVKSELIRAIGGKSVRIVVEKHDQYGRVVGTVTCDEKDVGEWLVHSGYAFAEYGDRYKEVEREARRARRGMWGYPEFWHPQDWRRRSSDHG